MPVDLNKWLDLERLEELMEWGELWEAFKDLSRRERQGIVFALSALDDTPNAIIDYLENVPLRQERGRLQYRKDSDKAKRTRISACLLKQALKDETRCP